MSKRKFSQFIGELKRAELQEQLFDLYDRFKNVKEFYDFSFNPNEDKRFELAKQKIRKEYFPESSRKAKKRRSIAQKQIVQFQKLEADPVRIADLMLYSIELPIEYCESHQINQEAFYKSMLSSFQKALLFIEKEQLAFDFMDRAAVIVTAVQTQQWFNQEGFENSLMQMRQN